MNKSRRRHASVMGWRSRGREGGVDNRTETALEGGKKETANRVESFGVDKQVELIYSSTAAAKCCDSFGADCCVFVLDARACCSVFHTTWF